MKLIWWGLFGQGCKGVASHLTFFWRLRVLAEDARDGKSPHVFPRVSKKNEIDLVAGCKGISRFPVGTRDHVTVLNKLGPAFCLNTNPSGLQVAEETLRFQGSQCHYSRMANILYRQESGPM